MLATHSVAAARWYAATQGDHFSAQAGDGQNELFLTPDNVLPPALLMWALVLTSFSVCCVTRGREAKHVCRCTAADCVFAVIKQIPKLEEGATASLFDYHRTGVDHARTDAVTSIHSDHYIGSFSAGDWTLAIAVPPGGFLHRQVTAFQKVSWRCSPPTHSVFDACFRWNGSLLLPHCTPSCRADFWKHENIVNSPVKIEF